jgi:SAM-dependent methyltransferase
MEEQRLHLGDEFDLENVFEFDCALLLFTSFGYFSEGSNSQVIQNLAKALRPGGLLCLDIPNRDLRASDMPPCTVIEKEGNLMIDRHSFDPLTGRWHNKRIIIRDGIRKDKPFSIRLYNLSEIQNLLANAGLRLTSTYADWDGNPLTSDSRRMIIIAQKR